MATKNTTPEIHLDLERMRVICFWDEPRPIMLNKSEHTLAKRRSFSLRISQGGRLNKQDYERMADHPKLPAVLRFVQAMKRSRLLPMREAGTHTCDICGSSARVFPHFDAARKKIVWRCGEHRDHAPMATGQA